MVVNVINRFSEEAPAAVLFRGLFARVFSKDSMDQIFRDHKEKQVESDIVFSSLVNMLAPVVTGGMPSAHASYVEHQEELGASKQAVYDKLQRVEPAVSAAMVRVPADELAKVMNQARATQPDPIPGYHTFVIDGKRLDGTEHRILETRKMKSAPLPGTVLALLDTRLHMFVDVACDLDAYACERKVVLPILDHLKKGALYLADRNFCDGPLINRFVKAESFFILRHHGRSPRWRKIKGCRRRRAGTDDRGRAVYEQEIEVMLPDETWHRLRRITIKLDTPTKNGETELHVLTNLPESVSAVTVAEAYADRWTIETCLGHVSQALNGEINTLAYPGASLLCFCLALMLFNILGALKTLLTKYSKGSGKPALSYYYLALEIATTRKGMDIVIDGSHWERIAAMSASEFISWVKSVARHANLEQYRSHPRGPKRPPPNRTSGKRRAHVSTHRILEQRKSLA